MSLNKVPFLNEKDISLHTIWAWAKQISDTLNIRGAQLGAELPPLLRFWPGAVPVPQGWLDADGALLEKKKHPELFVAIQYAYGGSGAMFQLPDYTGLGLADLKIIVKG